ncbi:MAG: hypothetical protein ABSE45_14980 [Candidatus Acidiferrales bacterium]|jgi:hypothetical protein
MTSRQAAQKLFVLALIGLLAAAPAGAGISYASGSCKDGGNNGGSTNSLTFSFTTSSGANRELDVCLQGDTLASGHDDITGVTYNSVSMSLVAKMTNSNQDRYSYHYELQNPSSGTHNVVVSATNNHYLLAGAAEYDGVAQSGQPDTSATNITANSTVDALTTSVTTSTNNDWTVLCEGAYDAGGEPTAGTGATLRCDDGTYGTWGLFDSNGAITPAGSYSMTTDRGGSTFITHIVAALKPYVAAGSCAPSLAATGAGCQ